MNEDAQIVLASASPRRRELLRQIGVRFRQQVAEIDESRRRNEGLRDYVTRLALEKARAVARLGDAGALPVLGADTIVALGDRALGKPAGPEQAREMLSALSGRSHEVMTAVALAGSGEALALSVSRVWFRPLTEQEIEDYWRSGEPRDKAGAYAIQGLGAVFVERLEGSYSGVMGLPLYETARLLQDSGIQLLDRYR
ncbi:MAG TPA: septum formation inhibitor Maf [Gammaproteobacteria bacterium]|nr:septum formation inhibitor Maf [Gammaproteobacteria bacterium]